MSHQNLRNTGSEPGATQRITLAADGSLLDSDDGIFDAFTIGAEDLLLAFPLVESIFDSLLQRAPSEGEIRFPGVETVFPDLRGIYDFSFLPEQQNGERTLRWTLTDRTTNYRCRQLLQQSRQEDKINDGLS